MGPDICKDEGLEHRPGATLQYERFTTYNTPCAANALLAECGN
jgi:hypothetical protein